MVLTEWLVQLPLWGMFWLTLALCVTAIEAGGALARLVLRRSAKDPDAPLGSLVGALLGLLAFFLAFTFSMTAARFDARKQLVLDEANAIGTTYLRAALLPPKEGLEIRRLLREYTDLRMSTTKENLARVMARSEAIQGELWAQTRLLVQEDMDPQLRGLFVVTLNETIDLHQSRKTVALQYRIPDTVWLGVYLLLLVSMMAVGFQVGMSGVKRLHGAPVLALAFSLAIVMIADIDRPGEGSIRVSLQPLVDARASMAADMP